MQYVQFLGRDRGQLMATEKQRENARARSKRWRTENRENEAARSKRWHTENREKSAASSRRWQRENREKARAIRNKCMARRRAIINGWKNVPCRDCGNRYPPCAMDFDHVRGKSFLISRRISGPLSVLEEEREKCDVVCSNCHRIRTALRRGEARN